MDLVIIPEFRCNKRSEDGVFGATRFESNQYYIGWDGKQQDVFDLILPVSNVYPMENLRYNSIV